MFTVYGHEFCLTYSKVHLKYVTKKFLTVSHRIYAFHVLTAILSSNIICF